MILDYQDGDFILTAPARYRDLCKDVGLKFNNKLNAYVGPATWTHALVAQGLLVPYGLQVTEAAINWVKAEAVTVRTFSELAKSEDNPNTLTSRTGKQLKPWQMNDVMASALNGRAIDTSDRGTGKGPKVISALRQLHSYGREVFPHLTVTRPLAQGPIAEEWLEWFPELTPENIVVVPGGLTKTQRTKLLEQDAKVFVLPYHLVPLHSRLARYGTNALTEAQKTPKELNGRFKSVFVDEAHRLIYRVGEANIQTRSIWSVLDEVDIKFLATGTPIADAPDDLWSLLRALWPDEFSSSSRYKTRYCNTVPQFFGPDLCVGLRPDTEAEFRQIMAGKILGRRKEHVLKDLPAKQYLNVSSPMEGKQLKAYNAIASKGVLESGEHVMVITDPLVRRTRLMQLAFGTPVLGVKSSPEGEYIAPVELTVPSNKVDALMETLEEYDCPIVVWVAGRLELDLCARQLDKAEVSYVEFKGGMKEQIREAGRKRFQTGEVRVALCLLQVASEALTLTAAPVALYLQREDSMIDSTQSEDRIHRIGQTQEVLVIDHVSEGTEELAVHENYLAKERRANEALKIDREQREVHEPRVS